MPGLEIVIRNWLKVFDDELKQTKYMGENILMSEIFPVLN